MGRDGRDSKGSSGIFLCTRMSSATDPGIGRTFRSTGLYKNARGEHSFGLCVSRFGFRAKIATSSSESELFLSMLHSGGSRRSNHVGANIPSGSSSVVQMKLLEFSWSSKCSSPSLTSQGSSGTSVECPSIIMVETNIFFLEMSS